MFYLSKSEQIPTIWIRKMFGNLGLHWTKQLLFFHWNGQAFYDVKVKNLSTCQWMLAQMIEQLLYTRQTRVQIPAPAPYEITIISEYTKAWYKCSVSLRYHVGPSVARNAISLTVVEKLSIKYKHIYNSDPFLNCNFIFLICIWQKGNLKIWKIFNFFVFTKNRSDQ